MAEVMSLRVLARLGAWLGEWWVEKREHSILRQGRPLREQELALARCVGVASPEKVRLMVVREVPVPVPRCLHKGLKRLGWMPGGIAGMTLGHGICLHHDWGVSSEVLAHELTHVAQFERLGGIEGFLVAYFEECLEEGYPNGPLEQEAIRSEGTGRDFLG